LFDKKPRFITLSNFHEIEFYFTPDDPKKNPKKVYKNFLDCGKGGYGRVFSATSSIDKDKEKVAIKKMPHTTEKERRHNLRYEQKFDPTVCCQ